MRLANLSPQRLCAILTLVASSATVAATERVPLAGAAVFERVLRVPTEFKRPAPKQNTIYDEVYLVAQSQWRLNAPLIVKAPGGEYTLEAGTIFSAFSFDGEIRPCNIRRARLGLLRSTATRNLCLRDLDGDGLADHAIYYTNTIRGSPPASIILLPDAPSLTKIPASSGHASADEPPGLLVSLRIRIKSINDSRAVLVFEQAEARAFDDDGNAIWFDNVQQRAHASVSLSSPGQTVSVGNASIYFGGVTAAPPLSVTQPPAINLAPDGLSASVGDHPLKFGISPAAGPPIQIRIPG